ncbi:MAG: polysaccharide deacetylase family protein [Roseiflexaceae bacterium]
MRRSIWSIAILLTLHSLIPGRIDTARAQATIPTTVHVPILMYHYISANPDWPNDPLRTRLSVPPRQFAAQLAYLLRAGYTTITLDDLVAALHGETTLPIKPVILTFDDGYADFYTNAYPLLQQYHDRATIYIISQRVATPGYLDWDQLRSLAASPLITIGAHTRTHPMLTTLSAEQQWDELAGSKSDLEAALGVSVQHLAYPSGNYNAVTLQQVEQIGFTTAVTTRVGQLHSASQVLLLKRVRVNGGTGIADFIAGLTGTRQVRVYPTRRARPPARSSSTDQAAPTSQYLAPPQLGHGART